MHRIILYLLLFIPFSSNGQTVYKTPSGKKYHLAIYTQEGKKLNPYNGVCESSNVVMPISNFVNGKYIIKATINKQQQTQSFIKQ